MIQRIKQKYREEDSGSGVDTQTSETRESDDYYANLKKLESEKEAAQVSWQNDKSDLDSLDSGYFKNSHHQPVRTAPADQSISTKLSTKYQVLEIEVHNQNIRHSSVCTTETTTTHSDESVTLQEESDLQNSTSNTFEDITLSSEKESSDCSAQNSTELNINYNTLTLTRQKLQTDSDEGTFEKRFKFKEDRKSVVSYDSIYLSSEGSNENTIVDDKLEDPLPELRINSEGEFFDVEDDPNIATSQLEQQDTSTNLDSLYSQINKVKPKILSFEPKTNLTSFSDTSTRGTLERLTFISSSAQQKEYQKIEEKLYTSATLVGGPVDNQYCSLPDANIGISLRASERIDAKLRLSCSKKSEVIEGEETSNIIYDSITRFGKAHKRLRQRESFEIVVLNPISIDEQPKEAPSIEVNQPQRKSQEDRAEVVISTPGILKVSEITREAVKTSTQPKVVENKLKNEKQISFISVNKQKKKEVLPTTICLGTKQVIVDELAAKAIKITKREKEQNDQQNKNISRTLLKAVEPPPTVVAESNIVIENCVKPSQPARKELKSLLPRPTHTQEEPIPKKVLFKPKRSLTDLTPESFKLRKQTSDPIQPKTNQIQLPKLKTVSQIPKPPLLPEKVDTIAPKKVITKPKKLVLTTTTPERSEALRNEFKANLTDTLKKRIAQTRKAFNGGETLTTFKARPIRISSVENISKLPETYEINPSLTYKVKLKDQRAADKMSRPQILNVIDTKRSVCSVAPRQSFIDVDQDQSKQLDNKVLNSNGSRIVSSEVQQEFQEKVDAVRCYWSKLIDKKDQSAGIDEVDHVEKPMTDNVLNFVTSVEEQQHQQKQTQLQQPNRFIAEKKMQLRDNSNDVSSFSPMVEIIELDGQKQAAVVNARCIEDQDFDHVRYKVMKSDTFQKNILTQSRKEAQFDGLLQYLHNYSFQVSQM